MLRGHHGGGPRRLSKALSVTCCNLCFSQRRSRFWRWGPGLPALPQGWRVKDGREEGLAQLFTPLSRRAALAFGRRPRGGAPCWPLLSDGLFASRGLGNDPDAAARAGADASAAPGAEGAASAVAEAPTKPCAAASEAAAAAAAHAVAAAASHAETSAETSARATHAATVAHRA